MSTNVILLGKGSLAIRAAEWFLNSEDFSLELIVPDLPEPEWTGSLVEWAKANSIPMVQTGKHEDVPASVTIDVAVSIFYSSIIKKDFIDRCGEIVNLHSGPLPKYRGVRPINWALKNDEISHGVTIHKITEGIDDGPILGQVTYPIYPEVEEVRDVYFKSLEYGWLLFLDVFKNFNCSSKGAREQLGEATYFSKKDIGLLKERENFDRRDYV